MLQIRPRRRGSSASEAVTDEEKDDTRRGFLWTTGRVAAVAAVPAAVLAGSDEADAAVPGRAIPNVKGLAPDQPVMAYVHNAKHGVVVIMDGTSQRTVRDAELVRRLTVVPKKRRLSRKSKTAKKKG